MVKITMFGKFGGDVKNLNIISEYSSELSKILKDFGELITVVPDIQFHIEYRIDGDFFKYNDPPGCSNLRLMKKKNVIGNTVAVTHDLMEKLSEFELKEFFKENIVLAISQMIDRLIKDKYELNRGDILSLLEDKLK